MGNFDTGTKLKNEIILVAGKLSIHEVLLRNSAQLELHQKTEF